jgi:hypothetical protein
MRLCKCGCGFPTPRHVARTHKTVHYHEFIPSHRYEPRAPGEIAALKRARALIEDEERWAAGTLARDEFGRETGVFQNRVDLDPPIAGAATQWSAVGACVYEGLPVDRAYELLYVQPMSPLYVEEGLGHAETLAMFDRAIAALRDFRSVDLAA